MNNSILYISRKAAQDFLDKFEKALLSPNSSPLLFQIYGIGGVGKTTLTKKLEEAHNSKADFAKVSFGLTPGIETPLKLMEKLYELLPKSTSLFRKDVLDIRKSDFMPKSDPFTSLYEQYEQTIRKLNNQPVEGAKVEAEQQNTVKDWCELGTITALAAGTSLVDPGTAASIALEGIPKAMGMLSDASQSVKSTKDKMQKLLEQHPATKEDRELQELVLEPIPKLTQAFAQGLIQKTQGQKRSIVLVLDTYEKVPTDIDTWLWQYLLEDTPLKSYGVRIMVAGRRSLLEKESWRKLQQDRQNLIYEQRLDEFDRKQTEEYLKQIGITKSGDIQKIYKVTKGLPYYLDWIKNQKEKKIEIDFSRGNQAIVELLLQGLNTKQKQIVQLAACCRWFDRPLIQYLMQRERINFETGASNNLNCFDWLNQCDFVEFVEGCYRLDDVARDVFRMSLYHEGRSQFRETHELLAKYFEQLANKEVSPDSSPPAKYENADWREYTAESLYHALFANRDEGQRQFISHLFASRYLNQLEVVIIPFAAITAEASVENYQLLPDQTGKLLKKITFGFVFGWFMLSKDPAKYEINYENGTGPSKNKIEAAIKLCFDQVDFLEDGLGKYAWLLYKSLRSRPNQRVHLLEQAKTQAEIIASDSYPEFSSNLFFNLGNLLINLQQYEEALYSFDKALTFKDDDPEIWNNRGVALGLLERDKEALHSFDKALAITDDDPELWKNRGLALRSLERHEEALNSFDKALAIKDDDPDIWYYRGSLLRMLHRYKDAVISIDKALKYKVNEFEFLSVKGLILSLLGNYNEALTNLKEALKLEPKNPLLWANNGIILARAGRYKEALENCDKALELNPQNESGYYGKACFYALQDEVDLALANLQQAININASQCRPEAKYNPDFDSIRNDERFQKLLLG
ncbi:tetratricopeptide repeat protein [Nodularia harveyana UHCC-0300]|uniref:Tetratricopeptide repeat protein n=1 Tax=Nodularia harveyana UHCC-0300 TaxID=2974287 RepID=A0ABU5U905_9CYAN|nr:tetratricopeptide repeat protein [Nodularia harveyana]MEA5580010.1 tetratricopeptide repeat protein [Nodularia harveyana UHCC-0300]